MSDEILEVPEEMKELMIDWKIYTECRDHAIGSFFKARRAIYYGRLAHEANTKFWNLARDLYPQIGNDEWSYNMGTEVLTKEV